MGPWCGAVCFLEVLRSLLQNNPQPYWYLQQGQGKGSGWRGAGPYNPRPKGESGSSMELEVSLVSGEGFPPLCKKMKERREGKREGKAQGLGCYTCI
jgi:hypothetical protein